MSTASEATVKNEMNTEASDMDALDTLDSGVEALASESPMLASEVLAYLQSHPEFFSEHSDALARLSLPTQKNGNVISMANWQAHVLRDKAGYSIRHVWSNYWCRRRTIKKTTISCFH